MEWQRIETAPRDGSEIVIFTSCHGVVQAWFKPSESYEHHEFGKQWEGALWVCADDAFQIEVEEFGDNFLDGTVTHWHPLELPK